MPIYYTLCLFVHSIAYSISQQKKQRLKLFCLSYQSKSLVAINDDALVMGGRGLEATFLGSKLEFLTSYVFVKYVIPILDSRLSRMALMNEMP